MTVHVDEFPEQLRDNDVVAVIKCCAWSGLTEMDAAELKSERSPSIMGWEH